ncbi:hypothetical protein AGOR_G00129710 [Albula goreensis]|uniref:Exonuclease V n=1 Tax=Albula goreensis TaxID=1534307 RepID=A0A8T3DD06_9TELE|nr:hypothetical protein AGOR_G00129710 [Albula goreensis]
MNSSATELAGEWGDISDAELLNIKSEHLGTASPPMNSGSKVTEKLDVAGKRDGQRLSAVCAVEPNLTGSPRKRRRPGLGRSPMERFWRTHLAVTQVCSQTWCELQVMYGFELPYVVTRQEVSEKVKTGATIHLNRELEVHDVVAVPVMTREDRHALTFLNLLSLIPPLQAGQRVRELPVFGLLEGVFLMGVIDELYYSERGELVLSDLKTRATNTLPGPAQGKGHSLQVGLYKLLFDWLVQGNLRSEHVITHLRLRPERTLTAGVQEHAGKLGFQVSTFGEVLDLLVLNLSYCELPAVDRLQLEYCHQDSGSTIGVQDVPFAEAQLRADLRHYLSYWTGHREPRGVDIEEAWKCNSCAYRQHCEWKWEGSMGTPITPTKIHSDHAHRQDTITHSITAPSDQTLSKNCQ